SSNSCTSVAGEYAVELKGAVAGSKFDFTITNLTKASSGNSDSNSTFFRGVNVFMKVDGDRHLVAENSVYNVGEYQALINGAGIISPARDTINNLILNYDGVKNPLSNPES